MKHDMQQAILSSHCALLSIQKPTTKSEPIRTLQHIPLGGIQTTKLLPAAIKAPNTTHVNSRFKSVKNSCGKEPEVMDGSRDVNLLGQPDRLALISRLSLSKLVQPLLDEVCNLEQEGRSLLGRRFGPSTEHV